MKITLSFLSFVLMSLVWHTGAAHALTPLETSAKQAIIIDDTTGAVLFNKNADELMYPSSMTKVLTVYLIFERLRDRRLSLSDEFTVSPRAQSMEGTRMFIEAGKRVLLEDLLRGIIVDSGNDACVVVAESIAGTEAQFASEMTKKALEFGTKHTHFVNASGLPDPKHLTTARDLALIARHIIHDFSEYYHYFSEKEFTYNHITQSNRNALLRKDIGVDGLKTGSTDLGGLGMIASAQRNGRRIIIVANGFKTDSDRTLELERMFDWAYREFKNVVFAHAGSVVTSLETWGGSQPSVNLTTPHDIIMTVEKSASTMPQARIKYLSPVCAPITKGTEIAHLIVGSGADSLEHESPLVALESVSVAGFWLKIKMTLDYLLWGKQQVSSSAS